MYADLSDEEHTVRLINEQTKRELLKQNSPIADVLSQCTEEKVYILTLHRLNKKRILKRIFK